MKRRAAVTFAAGLLALGLWSMTAYSQDDDDKKAIKEAQEAVLKLVDSMNGKQSDVKSQMDSMRKKFEELKPIMWVYKSRKKLGIGMGKNGADDIEVTIGKIGSSTSKAKLTPKKLAEMKADLIKAGELSKAVAEVSDLYAEQYAKKEAAKVAKWKGYTKEMKKGGNELIEAVKSDDIAKVKKAANNLSASCTNCHSDFRND